AKAELLFCRSWLAGDGINWVYLMHRGVCIAGRPAPTLTVSAFAFAVAFDLQHSSRPESRPEC
ncbi:hypothetical protein QN410_34070, partial [Pseudomonas sp. Bout1]|nr:hypothetical protein [Pseudomonas sp. Bout1]